MKKFVSALALVVLSLGLATIPNDSDAKRLGGGSSIGRQRVLPPSSAPKPAGPASQNATQSAAAPAAGATAAAAAKPSFMQRFGPMLAGLGIGALLGSMFGGGLGGMLGGILMAVLAVAAVVLLFRYLSSRNRPASRGMQFAGAPGSAFPGESNSPFGREPVAERPMEKTSDRFSPAGASFGQSGAQSPNPVSAMSSSAAAAAPISATDPEVAALTRVAETAFIRLQAANDVGDLDDIRSATTPEMYAELATQLRERGNAPQRTEVVKLEAEPVDMTEDGDYGIFSVRYTGSIRETPQAEAEPFNEVWHFRRNLKDPKANWLIAGIQQA